MQKITEYYSGTSGLLLPVRNKLLYPDEFKDKSRLCFYSSMTNSIEINSSFYKVPMASTIARWANDVPEGFKFTFKLPKDMTHNKGLAFDPQAVRRFMSVIDQVGDKRACVLVQFPASVRVAQLRQLALLMNVLHESNLEGGWNIALEFRHASLYQDEIYRLLQEYGMGMVIQDKPPAATPIIETELHFIYLRFHGPTGSYRGSYEDELLYEYAGYIRDWISGGKTVYAYFNNTMGAALDNMFALRDLVSGIDRKN
jgi:uncharacterized protein YecE (DUF72 family)